MLIDYILNMGDSPVLLIMKDIFRGEYRKFMLCGLLFEGLGSFLFRYAISRSFLHVNQSIIEHHLQRQLHRDRVQPST